MTVSAPGGAFPSFNTLAINNVNSAVGSGQRLAVLNTLTISSRGIVAITNSVLRVGGPGGTLSVDGSPN